MYCFSAVGRAVLSACYDPSAHPLTPLPAKPEQPKMPSTEASPPPPAFPEKVEKPVEVQRLPAKARQQQVEDEMLKELEPTYVAPKRVGVVVSSREMKEVSVKSGRFDMDEHTEDAWDMDL